MSLKKRLIVATLPIFAVSYGLPAFAQDACFTTTTTPNDDGTTTTTIDGGVTGESTTPIESATANNGTACDVRIQDTGTLTITNGSAVTLNSDNAVQIDGTISSSDAENTTGLELVGGFAGDVTLNGSINLIETSTNEDTDNDGTPDGPFAVGAGRTGILISGASPFTGSVTTATGSNISVEGNDSFAFRIIETASLIGDLNFNGDITVTGGIPRDADGNATGSGPTSVAIEGDMTGDLNTNGNIDTIGEGATGILVSGDITGGLTNGGTIDNVGFRFARGTILNFSDAIDETDTLQAGSAIHVTGNISEGVFLQNETITENAGTADEVTRQAGASVIRQVGSAPAILFDGEGQSITIGRIAPVTDTDNSRLHYAFVNQGILNSDGTLDDMTATALEVRDATLEGGISNTGSMTTTAYRSTQDGTADLALSRVIVLGSGAIVDEINNEGTILAIVNETSEAFADIDNPTAPQELLAIAIDVDENASLNRIVNSSVISAGLVGRDGTAIAIRDSSGSITVIDNTGFITSVGRTSNPLGGETPELTFIAMDLSANTSGVTINQTTPFDADTTDDSTPADPAIIGDILLGSGDDVVNLADGSITGDLSFDSGTDSLLVSGGSTYSGTITNSGGLTISVTENSSLQQTTATPINATTAFFDGTSTFSPSLDGQTGTASTLITSGDITFADGSTIAPVLTNVVDELNNTFTILNAGGALNVGEDVASLLSFDSPFLYDTSFEIDPNNPNALLITLDLRDSPALGLDPVQSASFDAAYDALFGNQDLASAFVNITDGDQFRRALNQLLPEFAAASRQFVVANVDGAVGAVGSHLENARKSQEESGGAWIQEFTYFADRSLAGLSEQYRGFGFGFTGGFDTQVGPFHTAGVNVGFASTEIEDVGGFDDPLDVLTIQGGVYAGFETGDFSIDLYGGGGFNDFDQVRNVRIGNFDETSAGSWSGTHINGSIRGGYDIDVSKKLWIRPAFSVDYLRLSEDGYTETSALTASAIALDVDRRTSELAGATAMLNVGAKFEGRRTWLRPSVRVGYRNEFINDGVTTSYGFAGRDVRASLTSEPFPSDGFLLGFSLAAGTGYSSVGVDFDSDVRDGFIRHTGRIVLRMIF